MPPATLLRTAALVAAALFPATAFIGGCNGNSKSAAATASVDATVTASPPPPTAGAAFATRSQNRVKSKAHTPGAAHERLEKWPMAVLEDVRTLGTEHAWQPCQVEALRTEVAAMRDLAQHANAELGGTELGGDAVESAAATWPGENAWPGTAGWPREASTVARPIGVTQDLWQLRVLELVYCGLLQTSPVEEDTGGVPMPDTDVDDVELTVVATQLWSRRKCRLDQLALRIKGAFGALLPAASCDTCATLKDMDFADVAQARLILEMKDDGNNEDGDPLRKSTRSLREFINESSVVMNSAVNKINQMHIALRHSTMDMKEMKEAK